MATHRRRSSVYYMIGLASSLLHGTRRTGCFAWNAGHTVVRNAGTSSGERTAAKPRDRSHTASLSTRRTWGHLVVASTAPLWMPHQQAASAADMRLSPRGDDTKPSLAAQALAPGVTAPDAGRTYFPTLTPPFFQRATYRYDLGRKTWALEQLLTFANVTATIRCTVVELESTGGLWVHSPQYPTGELLQLLRALGRPVEHVVLPCNALEHKAPMQAFLSKFPRAQVWISPGQYGPFGSCGQTRQDVVRMGYRVDGILGDDIPPWGDEFDIATLYVDIPRNAGPVSEVAFCHRPTQTLVATDAVVYIPPSPSDIYTTYFDRATVYDDPTFWPRTVLQAVFLPLRTTDDGSYPGFEALQGRLVRAPILRAFADSRAPEAVRKWIAEITSWRFDRIVSSHFASPIQATPSDVRAAFAYLQEDSPSALNRAGLPPITCQDWELLEGLNRVIAENKLGAPAIYDYKRDCI